MFISMTPVPPILTENHHQSFTIRPIIPKHIWHTANTHSHICVHSFTHTDMTVYTHTHSYTHCTFSYCLILSNTQTHTHSYQLYRSLTHSLTVPLNLFLHLFLSVSTQIQHKATGSFYYCEIAPCCGPSLTHVQETYQLKRWAKIASPQGVTEVYMSFYMRFLTC